LIHASHVCMHGAQAGTPDGAADERTSVEAPTRSQGSSGNMPYLLRKLEGRHSMRLPLLGSSNLGQVCERMGGQQARRVLGFSGFW
jgi:hypothetical protein